MTNPMTPTADQERDIKALLDNPTSGALIASELGSGKTLVTVEFIKRRGASRVLVVCPLGTRIGWTKTIERQQVGLPVYRIESTKVGREAEALYAQGQPGVFLIGHALFRRKAALWEKAKRPEVAIYDEIQDCCNPKSMGYKILKKLKADYKIAMSGTWFGNKFENSYVAPRWCWWDLPADTHSGRYVDTSFYRWRAEWCKTEYDPFTFDNKRTVGEAVPGAWNAYLPLYIRSEAKLDVQAFNEDIFVELSASQRRMYSELERDALTWLGENPLVTDLDITTRIRLRQATLGELSLDDKDSVQFALDCKSSKLDALQEFLSNVPDEPVLIYTDSKRFAKVVVHRLGEKAAEWSGDTSHEERESLLSRFGRPGGPQYLVAVIAAMGPGVDGLQEVCNTLVWLSETEDPNLNQQALARLVRKGQRRNVRNVYIKAVGTKDEGIYSKNITTTLANRASMRKQASGTVWVGKNPDPELQQMILHDARVMASW
jgi:superfamily II DNA or RNA helicase